MKKFVAFILAAFMVLSLAVVPAFAESEIQVYVDGASVDFDQPPVIIDGRTLVPLRAIFEAMGATVDWDAPSRTAIGTKDDTTVKITIDEKVLYKNGVGTELDVPAKLIGGRTMVPARAISEAFGAYVSWNSAYRYVFVETQDEFKAQFLAKIGTQDEVVFHYTHQFEYMGYDTDMTVFYGADNVNDLHIWQYTMDLNGNDEEHSQTSGYVTDNNITYKYSTVAETTISENSVPITEYPLCNILRLATLPTYRAMDTYLYGKNDKIVVYRHDFHNGSSVIGYVDFCFDPQTAELVGMCLSPEVTAMILDGTANMGAGEEIYVNFNYSTGSIKKVWDDTVADYNRHYHEE